MQNNKHNVWIEIIVENETGEMTSSMERGTYPISKFKGEPTIF